MAKEFMFDKEGRKKILDGAEVIYKAVSTTFSPKGKNVVIETFSNQPPKITKDGVTVAKEVFLEDKFENLGATSLKEIALRTVDRVGDGTTTAIILAYNLLKAGTEETELTYKDIDCLKELSDRSVDYLNTVSIKLPTPDQIECVAKIASNDDIEISSMLKKCVEMLGEHGTILVEDTRRLDTSIDLTKGMLIKGGFVNAKLINKPERGVFESNDALVLVHDGRIESFYRIKYLLEQIMEHKPNNPLIIFSPGVGQDVINGLVANASQGIMQVCAVDITGEDYFVQDLLSDIAMFAGCRVMGTQINKPLGVNLKHNVQWTDLGMIHQVSVNKDRTILVPKEDRIDDIQAHKKFLEAQLESVDFKDSVEYITHRLSRCSEGLALLKVGGLTQQSTKERRDRIDDAVCAVQAARKSGIIPGCGLPYLQVASYIYNFFDSLTEDQKKLYNIAYTIFTSALAELVKNMFKYKGGEADFEKLVSQTTAETVNILDSKTWEGFDLKANKFGNLHELGILEPTAVAIETIRSSISVASLLINSGAFITHSRKPANGFYNPEDWVNRE